METSLETINQWLGGKASQNDAVSAASLIKNQYLTAQQISPPTQAADAHRYLLNSLKQYDHGATLLLQAINTGSKRTLTQAQAAFGKGDPILQKCLQMLSLL